MQSPGELQPRRVLFAGDTHGYASAIDYLTHVAGAQRCPVICQLGDFGYWPHQADGARFLVASERLAARRGVVIVFIDGNHEDFDLLWADDRPRTDAGFVRVSEHILYAPRGLRWRWRGVGFLALGGAHSIDKEWRLALERGRRKPHQRRGWFWWPQETLTDEDVARAVSGEGRVDVLLSHDCPDGVELEDLLDPAFGPDPNTMLNRRRVRRVVDAVHPAIIFHAHYHVFHERPYVDRGRQLEIPCTGLSMQDTGQESWKTLDLEEFKATYAARFDAENPSHPSNTGDPV